MSMQREVLSGKGCVTWKMWIGFAGFHLHGFMENSALSLVEVVRSCVLIQGVEGNSMQFAEGTEDIVVRAVG